MKGRSTERPDLIFRSTTTSGVAKGQVHMAQATNPQRDASDEANASLWNCCGLRIDASMSSSVNFGFLKSAVVFSKLFDNPSGSNCATRSSTSPGCNGWTSNGSQAIPGKSFKLSVASTTLAPDALAQSAAASATCTSSESGNCNRGTNTELFCSTSKRLSSACHPGGRQLGTKYFLMDSKRL